MKRPVLFPLLVVIMVIATLIVTAITLTALYTDFNEVSRQVTGEGYGHTDTNRLFMHAGVIAVIATLPVIYFAGSIFFRISQRQNRKIVAQAEAFETISTTAHEAILLIDTVGNIQHVNPSTSAMFGFTANELTGENIKILMPSPHQEKYKQYNAEQLRTGFRKITGLGKQLTGQRKDGTQFPIHLKVGQVGPENNHLYAAVIMDLSIQQKLQREILKQPERERQRIGEELHDGLGQQLTGLSMLAESLLNKASRPEHELADQLASGLHDALAQVRTMSRGLMPVQIYADGFIISLREITENIEQQSHIPIKLQIDDTIRIADDETASHLYRIVQESLNNAVKHASASLIAVSLKREQDHGLLEIIDDGIGIPLDLDKSTGLGLNIMRHRCGMFDGEITINPAGQRGTQVRCRFPINPVNEPPA